MVNDIDFEYKFKTKVHRTDIINTIGKMFISMVYMNIPDDEAGFLTKYVDFFLDAGDTFGASDFCERYCIDYVEEAYSEKMREFLDLSTLGERLRDEDIISCEYKRKGLGWCRGNLFSMTKDESGKVISCIFGIQIIDAEKTKELEAQEAIRVSNERYIADLNMHLDTVLGGITGGFKISNTDSEYSFVYISEAAAKCFGYTVDELIKVTNNSAKRLIYSQDFKKVMMEGQEGLVTKGEFASKYRVICKDGNLKWIVENGRLVHVDGKDYVYSFYLDVTELETANRKLVQERKQYQEALMDDCKFAFVFDLTEGMVEKEFILTDGYNPLRDMGLKLPTPFDDLLKKWFAILRPQFIENKLDDVLSRRYLLEKFEAGERKVEFEFFVDRDNSYNRIVALLSQNEETEHVQACVICYDITEIREKERRTRMALRDAYKSAKYANQAKSDFLSRMSHDIRTPMNAIVGMTAIAGAHINDEKRVKDCLNKISISSKHLLALVNEVLDMSKIESGKLELREEEFNISETVDNLLLLTRQQIVAKNQTLNVNLSNVEHELVIGDSQRLQQVFINIMSNAIKYTPEGGEISIFVSENESKVKGIGNYEFVFRDTGIGMSNEFLKHIFEPFARAEDERISKIQGTGLGMVIAKTIVQMMNGDIRVESELGKGSTFIVTFNLKLQEDKEVSYDDLVDLPVLVVDDDEDICINTCEMLDTIGIDGMYVLSGEEAVVRVENAHNDDKDFFAVILDWKMPEMDGVETAREIRKRVGNEVPIIVLSAYDWTDIEDEARKAGVDAFISKPLFKSRLVSILQSFITENNEKDIPDAIQQVRKADFSKYHVLLVEDNELNAEIANEILKETGLTITNAWNGLEAVNAVKDAEPGTFDLIFMDIQMPVMNGYEATKAIRELEREDTKELPIIAMTANAFLEDVENAKSAGMNEHMAKPINIEQLVSILGKWLQD